MNIRPRIDLARIDAPHAPKPPSDLPRSADRGSPAPTAPLDPGGAHQTSRLGLKEVTHVKEKAEKAKRAAEELERGTETLGSGSEEGAGQGAIASVENGIVQGAMTRRIFHLGADLARAAPVMDRALDAGAQTISRMSHAGGPVGIVGKALQAASTAGGVVEGADNAILARAAADGTIEQVRTIQEAVRNGDIDTMASETGSLARGVKDIIEGTHAVLESREAATVGRKALQVASSPLKEVVLPLGKTTKPVVQGATRLFTRVAQNSGVRLLSRAGARFVPGVNAAIAAAETYHAARTLANPKAGLWQKARDVTTAAGSIAAASNFPVVSQVGAGIAIVSSLLPDQRPKWLGGR